LSVDDPLVISLWHDRYILQRGREAIYQDEWLMNFETIEGARAWAFLHLNEDVWWPTERLAIQPPRPKHKKDKEDRVVDRQFTFLGNGDEGVGTSMQEPEGIRDGMDGDL